MDHLIHVLVKGFLPNIKHCHKRQMLGMEGPNLAEKCRQQILRHAPKTPVEKIKEVNDLHFKVQLLNSSNYYKVNLITLTCDCSDFPAICLCKHIAAVIHFFGVADLGPQPPPDEDESGESAEHKSPDQPIACSVDDDTSVLKKYI